MLETQHRFWFVQRIEPLVGSRRGWFGDRFELDYMGSAEFEFGATHKAIARMRELGDFRLHELQLTRKGVTKTVYCVAPATGLERKLEDFTVWATQDYPKAKEFTQFSDLFDEDYRLTERKYIHTVAWWSLHDDILWTLDHEVAEQLLYGLEHPAKA